MLGGPTPPAADDDDYGTEIGDDANRTSDGNGHSDANGDGDIDDCETTARSEGLGPITR